METPVVSFFSARCLYVSDTCFGLDTPVLRQTSKAKMSGEREDILLQVNHVRYKKNNGQLYLSQSRVGWMMDDSDTFTVSVQYSDIRSKYAVWLFTVGYKDTLFPFWKPDQLSSGVMEFIPNQDVGISGAFLADIKPQTDGSNGKVQYNITPEIMLAVFKTYPAVKKKHSEYVPHRMSEAEFWTRFFQSHYYSVHTNSSSENVFSECAKYDDKEWNRDVESAKTDPLYDLNDIYEEKPMSIDSDIRIAGAKAGSNIMHATMIKRLVLLLEKCIYLLTHNRPTVFPNGDADPEVEVHKSKKVRLEEKVTYDDLQGPSKVESASLTINQTHRYLIGPTEYSSVQRLEPRQVSILQQQMVASVCSWKPDLPNSQDPDAAYMNLQQFSDMCRRGRTSGGIRSGDELPGKLHKELTLVYSSAGELLRHFWSCFPPRTPQLQEKLHRMHQTLCRYHEKTIRPFRDMAVNDYNCNATILDHLLGMINIANTKYENWKARNSR
ncbi:general transcription factor IIH subunit 1 [Macrobrachium rosenbergii]|uniref:general transcription factor IIH subunit 1 n=1 Tax=Macrobrachium rosenbergii TaxID=79674 RepID=UPI0034D5CFE4